jgi:probable HAF family extracellular repeat protein
MSKTLIAFLHGVSAAAAVALLAMLAGPAQAQSCASGAVPCFQGLGTTFTAAAVSNNAVVAGSAGTQAATWAGGTIAPLGFLPSCSSPCSSNASGINSAGSIVVGSSTDANGNVQAAQWINGAATGLGYLPGCTSSCSTRATGISSDGSTVTGSGTTSNLTEAFSWTNGSLSVLQFPTGCPQTGFLMCDSQANAVNSSGSVIAGSFGPGPQSIGLKQTGCAGRASPRSGACRGEAGNGPGHFPPAGVAARERRTDHQLHLVKQHDRDDGEPDMAGEQHGCNRHSGRQAFL